MSVDNFNEVSIDPLVSIKPTEPHSTMEHYRLNKISSCNSQFTNEDLSDLRLFGKTDMATNPNINKFRQSFHANMMKKQCEK